MFTANVWHVPGADVDLVVDTANGIGPLLPHVDPLTHGKPVIAFVTHGHFDHVGGLHEFDDRRIHEGDADMARSPWPMRLRREDFPDGMEDEYAYYDVPVPDVAVNAVPSLGFDVAGWTTPAVEPTRLLSDGDRIDLGNRSFTVIHAPGHTAGSACLFDESDGTLFTGDALYVDAALQWDDVAAMSASLSRIRDLGAWIAHAGHERSFEAAELRQTADTWRARRGGRRAPPPAPRRAIVSWIPPREPQDPSPVIRCCGGTETFSGRHELGTLPGGGSRGLERRASTTTFQVSAAAARTWSQVCPTRGPVHGATAISSAA
jgi:glyoxylase-like metal-dependent hydrolase (beta-lactamase superfamily II)